MLRKITLQNFKNWRQLDIDVAPISLLFGTNSAGKTGILQSLLLLKQTAKGIDPQQHMNFGGGDRDYADFGSYKDLVFGHKDGSPISLGLTWDLSADKTMLFFPLTHEKESERENIEQRMASLRYEITWKLDDDLYIEQLNYSASLEDEIELSVQFHRVKGEKYTLEVSDSFVNGNGEDQHLADEEESEEERYLGPPGSCYMIPFGLHPRGTSLGSFKVQPVYFSFAFGELMDDTFYLGPLRQYPKRYYQWTGEKKSQVVEPDGADTISTLVSSERDDKSLQKDVAKWLGNLELVEAFNVKATDRNERFYEVAVKIDGIESALVDVGFGVSQVLPVVTLLFSVPEGSIVLLEQPELHLHPNAQSLLADLLLYVAEARSLQVIVESHSEHILRRLQVRIAEGQSEFATPENIKMYFCEPAKGGSTISEVELDRFGQIANWPDKFLGDISGDLHTMAKAAIRRRREELVNG